MLDVAGALAFMVGVICYLIGTIAAYWPLTTNEEFLWVTAPFNTGGVAFIVGSYLYLVSGTESFFALRFHPRSFAWCVARKQVTAPPSLLHTPQCRIP